MVSLSFRANGSVSLENVIEIHCSLFGLLPPSRDLDLSPPISTSACPIHDCCHFLEFPALFSRSPYWHQSASASVLSQPSPIISDSLLSSPQPELLRSQEVLCLSLLMRRILFLLNTPPNSLNMSLILITRTRIFSLVNA